MTESAPFDDGSDAETEAYLRRRRRGAMLRLLVAGLLATAAGLALYLYGHHLNARQKDSEVHYALPDQLEFAGVAALIAGVALIVAGSVIGLRGAPRMHAVERRRSEELPK